MAAEFSRPVSNPFAATGYGRMRQTSRQRFNVLNGNGNIYEVRLDRIAIE